MTAVEFLIDWMGKNQYFIGNDLLQAVEQAKAIEISQKAEEYLKGFKDGKEYKIKLNEVTFKSK